MERWWYHIENKTTTDGIALDFSSLQAKTLIEIRDYLANENRGRKFSRDEIRDFLRFPDKHSKQLRDASLYLASTSSHYMRLLFYMANMLTLDNLVYPYNVNEQDVKTKPFSDNYKKAQNYVEIFNVKHELRKVLTVVMLEDVYFGYERKVGDSFMLQRLPFDQCKITGMEDGLFTFSFNMTYFAHDKTKLRNYPQEFTKLYNIYEKTGVNWQPLDTDYAVCFKFREDLNFALPPFTSVFEEILDLEDLKDLVKAKDKLENFKLLLQKIPFKKDPKSERDFLIGLDSVKMFHEAIKNVLPSQIGLISSPMDIEDFSFEPRSNATKKPILDAEEDIFNSAGISSGLFNAGNKSAVSLNRAIQTDESMMFGMLRQFERFFNRRVNQYTSKKFRFKVMFPDISVYNRSDKQAEYLQMAQYGYPKTLVACSLGMSSGDLMGLTALENDFLELGEKLTPLVSSHTMTDENEGAGREEVSDSKISDKGAETRDSGSNIERDNT